MKYQVTTRVSVEKKGNLLTKVIKLESETPLTVKEIKEQCFSKLDLDLEKYTKKSEEVWQRGFILEEANQDADLFDKSNQRNPDYILILSEK